MTMGVVRIPSACPVVYICKSTGGNLIANSLSSSKCCPVDLLPIDEPYSFASQGTMTLRMSEELSEKTFSLTLVFVGNF